MKSSLVLRSLLWRAATALALIFASSAARAFDTGHHCDLVRQTLQEEGFGNTAIQVAQVQNWLVDYYSSTITDGLTINLPGVLRARLGSAVVAATKEDMDRLHCDNLYSTDQVRNYWGHFIVNARAAFQQAAREGDTLKALTLLGVSLHTVQDFYSHSDWVETHPRSPGGPYRTETWFDDPNATRLDLYSGWYPNSSNPPTGRMAHGDWQSGLNKDSYSRPRWDEAYVFAYAASREWVNAVHLWIAELRPAVWDAMRAYDVSGSVRSALNTDLDAIYRIPEWFGHWKGHGSESYAEFAGKALDWTSGTDSPFVEEVKTRRVCSALVQGLLSNDALHAGQHISPVPAAVPAVPHVRLDRRAVLVRTLHLDRIDKGLISPTNFYAKVTVNGEQFVEAMQMHEDHPTTNWMTIQLVPATLSSVPLHYELWNEGGAIASEFLYDVNPQAHKCPLDVGINCLNSSLTGDLTGLHNSPATAVVCSGAGDNDRAVANVYITMAALSYPRPAAGPAPTSGPGTITGVIRWKKEDGHPELGRALMGALGLGWRPGVTRLIPTYCAAFAYRATGPSLFHPSGDTRQSDETVLNGVTGVFEGNNVQEGQAECKVVDTGAADYYEVQYTIRNLPLGVPLQISVVLQPNTDANWVHGDTQKGPDAAVASLYIYRVKLFPAHPGAVTLTAGSPNATGMDYSLSTGWVLAGVKSNITQQEFLKLRIPIGDPGPLRGNPGEQKVIR